MGARFPLLCYCSNKKSKDNVIYQEVVFFPCIACSIEELHIYSPVQLIYPNKQNQEKPTVVVQGI